MRKDLYELEVCVHGRPIREYPHQGRIYVEGRKGSEFSLRIRNNSSNRILAVLSVDGLSIMNGKAASYDSGGYVLAPHSDLKIPGWSLSMNEVAKFYFSQFGKSYAAKMDQPQNVGVIAAAIFLEKYSLRFLSPPYTITTTHPTSDPVWRTYTMSSQPAPYNPSMTNGSLECNCCADVGSSHSGDSIPSAYFNSAPEVGTGFGDAAEFKVQNTLFDRADAPCALLEALYDTKEGLLRKGVDTRRKPEVAVPNPFPGQFCQPPADRRK